MAIPILKKFQSRLAKTHFRLPVTESLVIFFNDAAMGSDLKNEWPAEISNFPLSFSKDNMAAHFYNITFGNPHDDSGKIRIKKWNEMVWVDFDGATNEHFEDAVCLLRNFNTGKMLA